MNIEGVLLLQRAQLLACEVNQLLQPVKSAALVS